MDAHRNAALTALTSTRVVAILRSVQVEDIRPLARALYDGGIRLIEVTFRQDAPDSWENTARAIADLQSQYAGKLHIGAGTVLTLEQLRLAAEAGAEFILSPNADQRIVEATRAEGLLSIPGALTPSEIASAWEWGANIVKLFPAEPLGAEYLRAVRAPLKHIPLMAVGGIGEQNAGRYIAAGACCVGVGGSLTNPQWIREGAFARITAVAQALVQAVG